LFDSSVAKTLPTLPNACKLIKSSAPANASSLLANLSKALFKNSERVCGPVE
jgi:hypothetical protein